MNKVSKIVIGSNYGDEGKGLMTDYFCRQFDPTNTILNIRFNGGAQAGHTVVRQDGLRHVFSHFGAGSFNENVITVLDKEFVLNPILFHKEYESLMKYDVSLKTPYVYAGGLITLPMDMMINQFVEEARGQNRHGSCGVGINETIVRNEHPEYTTRLSDFIGLTMRQIVYRLIEDLQIYKYYEERISELGLKPSEEQRLLLYNENILYTFAKDLLFLIGHTVGFNTRLELLKEYNHFVFEGAQGLLLDKDNGIHTTPSHTGLENTIDWFTEYKHDIEVCYVTRSYFTRHGAGPFETECDKTEINPAMRDKTNVANEYQGSFRYGYFDQKLFEDSLRRQWDNCKRIENFANDLSESISVTHLNETNSCIVFPDELKPIDKINTLADTNVKYVSYDENTVNKR